MPNTESTEQRVAQPRGPVDADTEYGAAVSMVIYESQNFWTIMSAFLLAETLLAGFLYQDGRIEGIDASAIRVLGALVGVLGCWLWCIALLRSRVYCAFRIAQARALERRLGFSLFEEGSRLAAGERVEVDGKEHRHHRSTRFPTIRMAGVALALLFGLFFLAVLVLTVWKLVALLWPGG